MLSLGVPMILMGDEVRRTQGGNNNAYCHDDESNWFDWSLPKKHADVHRFVSLLLARRLLRDVEHEEQRVSLTQLIDRAEQGLARREAEPARLGRQFAQHRLRRRAREEKLRFHLILNGYWEPLDFELPPIAGNRMAAVDRYVPPLPRGHHRLEVGDANLRYNLPLRPPIGGHAHC